MLSDKTNDHNKGCLIRETVLLALELVLDFHVSELPTRWCLKVDRTKAFDNLHYDFILLVYFLLAPNCIYQLDKGMHHFSFILDIDKW